MPVPLKNRNDNDYLESWIKVFGVGNADNNDDTDSQIIIFTIKDTRLYTPVVTLTAKQSKTIKMSKKRVWKICILQWIQKRVKIEIEQMN